MAGFCKRCAAEREPLIDEGVPALELDAAAEGVLVGLVPPERDE
jgi:hypothetical protein